MLQNGEIVETTLTAADAGLPAAPAAAITGGDAAENAAALTALLAGARNPYRDTVLFNAAAALIVAGVVPSLRDGVAAAAHAIDSGRGEEVLANLVTASKEFSA